MRWVRYLDDGGGGESLFSVQKVALASGVHRNGLFTLVRAVKGHRHGAVVLNRAPVKVSKSEEPLQVVLNVWSRPGTTETLAGSI